MMSNQKRNTHSPELKAKVALEAVRGLKTANEIGRDYGVHPVQVSQWKKALLEVPRRCSTRRGGQAEGRIPDE